MISLNDISAKIRRIKKIDNAVIRVSGSKHVFVYTFLFALSCADKTVVLENVPNISDTDFLIEYATKGGAYVLYDKEQKVITIKRGIEKNFIWTPFVVNCRSSLIAVMLHFLLFSNCSIANSIGGCRIGERKIDQHIKLWTALGGEVLIDDTITINVVKQNSCDDFVFDIDTTMGTVCALFALTCGRVRKISKPSQRPEITSLVDFMNQLGYQIRYIDRSFVMDGVMCDKSYVVYRIPDDIDECLGWACFCHANNISAQIIAEVPYIESVKFLERTSNYEIMWDQQRIIVSKTMREKKLTFCEIIASKFPHIGSDQQPIFSVWASLICDTVLVEDRKFKNRFGHLEELKMLGWKSEVVGNRAKIKFTPIACKSVHLVASDLRAAFAYILAGTIVTDSFELKHYEQLFRGYSDINDNLMNLGFEITIEEHMSHGSVAILIKNAKEELFMQKRDENAIKNPGKVSFWGGAIEANETPYEAAQRELSEELGLSFPLEYIGCFALNQNTYSMSGTVFLFSLMISDEKLNCKEGTLLKRTPSEALYENLTVFARTVIESKVNQ